MPFQQSRREKQKNEQNTQAGRLSLLSCLQTVILRNKFEVDVGLSTGFHPIPNLMSERGHGCLQVPVPEGGRLAARTLDHFPTLYWDLLVYPFYLAYSAPVYSISRVLSHSVPLQPCKSKHQDEYQLTQVPRLVLGYQSVTRVLLLWTVSVNNSILIIFQSNVIHLYLVFRPSKFAVLFPPCLYQFPEGSTLVGSGSTSGRSRPAHLFSGKVPGRSWNNC